MIWDSTIDTYKVIQNHWLSCDCKTRDEDEIPLSLIAQQLWVDQSILQNLDIEPPTEENTGNWKRDLISCFVEGLPEVSGGNKGTLTKCRRENGNMSLFLENRGTKLYKLEDVNEVNKFIKRGTNKENVWEDGNIGQFWKRTREQGRP